MAISKELEQELKDWVYKEFWPKYPREWGIPGSRAKLLKYVLRDKPSVEDRDEILIALDLQKRFSKKKVRVGEFVKWPHASTWYNEGRYTDEIESSVELKERTEVKTCQFDGCGELIHGSNFIFCVDHLYQVTDPWKPYRKRSLIKMGLVPQKDEDLGTWFNRCKKKLLESKKSLKSLVAYEE